MKYDEFKKAVDRIIEDEDTLMIHVSPDFQCVTVKQNWASFGK